MNDLPQEWIVSGSALAFAVAYRILRPDAHTALDVAQNTMMKAVKLGLGYFDDRKHFMNWVATTARNEAIDIWRKRRVVTVIDDPPAIESESGPLVTESELAGVVADLLATLTPIEKKVLYDSYVLGRTLKQIGEELDYSVEGVRKIRQRAEARCRQVLLLHDVDATTGLFHLRELLAWLAPEFGRGPGDRIGDSEARSEGSDTKNSEPRETGPDGSRNRADERNRESKGEAP